jgi:hypothetical protein
MDQYIDPFLAGLVAGLVAWIRRGPLARYLDGIAVPALAMGLAVGLSLLLGGADLRIMVLRGLLSGAASVGGVSLLGYSAGKVGASLGGPVVVETLETEKRPGDGGR